MVKNHRALRSNIIAIVAISFACVGGLWGVGNLMKGNQNANSSSHVQGILLVAQNNAFNDTNPDLHAKAGSPEKVVVVNKDFVRHDFVIDQLNVNTAYLRTDQEFTTAIASNEPGTYQYYCSLHPQMHGKVIID